MRTLLIAAIAAFGLYQGWDHIEAARSLVIAEEDPAVAPAVALRCADEPVNKQQRCARELKRDFEDGTLVPEAIVRRHCTRFANGWAEDGEPPSDVCLQMYGGWIEG